MSETLSSLAGANGHAPAHDTGFSFSPAAPPRAEPPAPPDLRSEIRAMLAADPAPEDGDGELLDLMGRHDAALGAMLAKLPERAGAGGAVMAALARKYRGAADAYLTARLVAATLIFWPDPVPGDERLEDAALRFSEFNLEAAKELARAYTYLGARFTLQYSLRVLLEKYRIDATEFSAGANAPARGLTPAGVEAMLAQGHIELLNGMLRPFEIAIRQKIGTVNPVYSLVEKNNGRAVMPAPELVEFLRRRDVFA